MKHGSGFQHSMHDITGRKGTNTIRMYMLSTHSFMHINQIMSWRRGWLWLWEGEGVRGDGLVLCSHTLEKWWSSVAIPCLFLWNVHTFCNYVELCNSYTKLCNVKTCFAMAAKVSYVYVGYRVDLTNQSTNRRRLKSGSSIVTTLKSFVNELSQSALEASSFLTGSLETDGKMRRKCYSAYERY